MQRTCTCAVEVGRASIAATSNYFYASGHMHFDMLFLEGRDTLTGRADCTLYARYLAFSLPLFSAWYANLGLPRLKTCYM